MTITDTNHVTLLPVHIDPREIAPRGGAGLDYLKKKINVAGIISPHTKVI